MKLNGIFIVVSFMLASLNTSSDTLPSGHKLSPKEAAIDEQIRAEEAERASYRNPGDRHVENIMLELADGLFGNWNFDASSFMEQHKGYLIKSFTKDPEKPVEDVAVKAGVTGGYISLTLSIIDNGKKMEKTYSFERGKESLSSPVNPHLHPYKTKENLVLVRTTDLHEVPNIKYE